SLTGTNADERYRIGAQGELAVAMGLLHHLVNVKKVSRYSNDGSVTKALSAFADVESGLGLKAGTIAKVADALAESRGQSLVLAGNMQQSESSLAVQIAVNFLNAVLDNEGVTIDAGKSAWNGAQGRTASLMSLIKDLNDGKIKTLIIHGCNPLYSALRSGFEDAVKKPEVTIYTGDRMDETGLFADYLVPDHHSLENWDDMEAMSGAYTIQQ